MQSKYFISASGDGMWYGTNATTINGAKVVATKTYGNTIGGKLEVAELVRYGEDSRYETQAVKYGFSAWVNL